MLHPSQYYHLYNHANGSENLFVEERNYYFFLEKMRKHLTPYMNIYAYCLMPNHFHLLIRIKDETIIGAYISKTTQYETLKGTDKFNLVYSKISKSLANFFSCYTQSFNKLYQRKGSLFIPNFKVNPINNDQSFCAIVRYIHANPVHHGFVKKISDWKFSSFHFLCADRITHPERDHVLNIFGGVSNFLSYHSQPINRKHK